MLNYILCLLACYSINQKKKKLLVPSNCNIIPPRGYHRKDVKI